MPLRGPTSKGRGRVGRGGEEGRGSLCWPDHFSKADYGSGSWVRFPVLSLSSYLGQLSLSSLRGR